MLTDATRCPYSFLSCKITQTTTAHLHRCQATQTSFISGTLKDSGLMSLWWAIPISHAGSQITIEKCLNTGLISALYKHWVFPALCVKTCLVTELCSGCSALQQDLKIHPPMRNSGAQRGKKSHLQPSILGEQHKESPARSSPLTPLFVQTACVEKTETVTLEEMNGIYQILYPGYSIDLYLLHKGEKTWIAVWVEREHLPAASWQTAWGLQHED